MTAKKYYSWIFLTLLLLITLHLKVFTLAKFQVSLGFLLIPLWTYNTYRIRSLKFTLIEKFLIFILIIVPFLPFNINNWSEFYNTYGQYLITYYLVIRCINKKLKIPILIVDKAIEYFQIILVVCVIFQYVFVVIIGKVAFFNLFQEYQLYYPLDYALSNGRMKAFYLEPSYLGFVAINIFWARLYLKDNSSTISFRTFVTFNTFATLILLFFARSSSGFIAFGIICIAFVLNKTDIKAFLRFGIIFFIGLFVISIYWSEEIFGILRLGELAGDSEKSLSGFMRITLPIQVLQKLWNDGYYFGLTFGQLDSYTFKMTNPYGESGVSNSLFLILGYFGLINILPLVYIVNIYLFKANGVLKSFIILCFLNLNNSGAFVTSQYGFIAFLIPFLVFSYKNYYSPLKKNEI